MEQTYNNIQIVLVDDGSPDRCPQMCDEWASKDSRIKVIHQENKGPAEARERGILNSDGEYLCFVDSDDYMDARMCEKVVKIFQAHDVDVVTFDYFRFSEKGFMSVTTEEFSEGIITPREAVNELVKMKINNFFWSKAYKRHVFDGIDFLHQRFFEDMGVMYKIFLASKAIYCLPEKLYFYRKREGSIVTSMSGKALSDLYYVQAQRYEVLLTECPESVEFAFARLAWAAIRLYDRSLWEDVDKDILCDAIEFLEKNKEKILSLEDRKRFTAFYNSRGMYDKFRMLKHKIGNIVKRRK